MSVMNKPSYTNLWELPRHLFMDAGKHMVILLEAVNVSLLASAEL